MGHLSAGLEVVVNSNSSMWCKVIWSRQDPCTQLSLTRNAVLPQVGLNEKLKGASGSQIPKKVIEAPFVQIPLGVTEDRLVGTVDIEASMKVPTLCKHVLSSCCAAPVAPATVAGLQRRMCCIVFVQGSLH